MKDEVEIGNLNHRQAAIAAAIHEVQMAAYSQEAALLGVEHFPPLDQTPEGIRSLRERFIGAWLEDALVGAISLETAEERDVMNIASLVVSPRVQRRGIARRLLRAALSDCEGRPVTVSTGAQNEPVLKLYEQFGFVEHGRRRVGPERLEIVTLRRPAE